VFDLVTNQWLLYCAGSYQLAIIKGVDKVGGNDESDGEAVGLLSAAFPKATACLTSYAATPRKETKPIAGSIATPNTSVCKFFAKLGICRNGDCCRFLHGSGSAAKEVLVTKTAKISKEDTAATPAASELTHETPASAEDQQLEAENAATGKEEDAQPFHGIVRFGNLPDDEDDLPENEEPSISFGYSEEEFPSVACGGFNLNDLDGPSAKDSTATFGMPAPDPKPKATRRNKSEIHARMAEIMSALDIRNEFLQLLLDEVTIELYLLPPILSFLSTSVHFFGMF
jgi:hypothetical protein